MSGAERDWHGLTVQGTQMGALHVGPIPGRKRIALYHAVGHRSTVLAYFRNEESALAALAWLDALSAFVGWAGSSVDVCRDGAGPEGGAS